MTRPQSIPERHSIDTSVGTRSTLHRYLGRQSVKSRLIFYLRMIGRWVCRNSADYQPTVDRVSTGYQSRYRSSIDREVDKGNRSTLDRGCLYYTWSKLNLTYHLTSSKLSELFAAKIRKFSLLPNKWLPLSENMQFRLFQKGPSPLPRPDAKC